MVIPNWDNAVLPTVRKVPPEEHDRTENRSPYQTSFLGLIERFATIPERVELLHSLLDYREALYTVGVTEGFQWLNGSFVEHVEARDRPGKEPKPYDIDVVTFYHQPDDQPQEFQYLFRPSIVRDRYNIDAFNLGRVVKLRCDDKLMLYTGPRQGRVWQHHIADTTLPTASGNPRTPLARRQRQGGPARSG